MNKKTVFSILLFTLLCFCSCASGSVPAGSDSVSSGSAGALTQIPTPTETPAPTATPTPSPTPLPSPTPTSTPTPTPTPTPVVTRLTFSFAGDVTLGSDVINQNSARNFFTVYEKVADDSYFFANMLPYFQEDDITLVNLEGTLSDRGTRKDKKFAFRGPSSYVNILTAGSIEAVSLGNNHSSDYGEESYADTIENLDDSNILHAKDADICYTTVKGIPVAMISVYYFPLGLDGTLRLTQSTIEEAKENGAALIIISFHWGTEGSTVVNETQKTIAHAAIDAGADIVIGHHPHRLQAIERYQGRYIVYSLGNFCFGGNTNPADKDTMVFRQTFTFVDGIVEPTDEAAVLPCSVSSVTDRNNYQPTPQFGEDGARIMRRINEYSSLFSLHFESSDDGWYCPSAE